MRPPQDSSFAATVVSGPAWMRTRIEHNIASRGLIYPWWIPILSMIGQACAVVGALRLRNALWPPELVALTLVLVVLPGFLMLVLGRHLPHSLETISALAAAGWLLADHLNPTSAFDIAPVLLAVVTGEVVARDGVRNGVIVAGVSVAMVLAVASGPGLNAVPVHLVDIALGFVIGYMLLWQMRALIAERSARETEHARATLAERQRIAREIHDLVAHSLSVTLLQITGARHALRDVQGAQTPEVVSEVDEALADAERVGRQAMADIRQTVSTLAEGPAELRALPGAADIADLVAQMERAGLAVEYFQTGDPGRVAQATGLGLYRIAQESLANIAKHAPQGIARMEFTVTSSLAHLVVRNPLPAGARPDGRGSGLTGMGARAAQLGATLDSAPSGSDWVVDLKVPLRERNGQLWCPRISRKLAW